jgi:hypothetical protein
MELKQQALQQIDDICAVLHNSIKGFISGTFMMIIGLYVLSIPFWEALFAYSVDKHLETLFGSYANAGIFVTRAAFYWGLAIVLGNIFDVEEKSHSFVQKVFRVGNWLPTIGLSVAAALAIAGYANIIAPIMLILVGSFFMFYGQFTHRSVSIAAQALILGGIVGILLTAYAISDLWIYLVVYQGLIFVVMGYVLHRTRMHHQA